MAVTNIHEAKTHFSKLIERVGEGEEITIAKAGRPVAKLVPYTETVKPQRTPGLWKGKVRIHPDFDKRDIELENLIYEGPIEPAS
jgi:prevent-host-death family protein